MVEREKLTKLVLEFIGLIDYDIQKNFDPDLSEDPEYFEDELERLVDYWDSIINE